MGLRFNAPPARASGDLDPIRVHANAERGPACRARLDGSWKVHLEAPTPQRAVRLDGERCRRGCRDDLPIAVGANLDGGFARDVGSVTQRAKSVLAPSPQRAVGLEGQAVP